MSTGPSKEATVRSLIAQWTAYRAGDYCQLKSDLYQVRNPGFNGSPPLSVWPPYLVNPDSEIMASVEHYFLARCWVGTGEYSSVQLRIMSKIYNLGKSIGVTPRHNPNNPVTPPSKMQEKFQFEGMLHGEADLKRSGKVAPGLKTPPKY
jgi:hypothetical protein